MKIIGFCEELIKRDMMDNRIDAAMIQYVFAILGNLYGVILFSWWWIKKKNASFMFICVIFLFIGNVVEKSLTLYSRVMMNFFQSPPLRDTVQWAYRGTIEMVVVYFVVIYMTLRVFGYLPAKQYGKRHDDQQ